MFGARQIKSKLFLINKNFDWRYSVGKDEAETQHHQQWHTVVVFFGHTIPDIYPYDKSYNMKENNSFHKIILDERPHMTSVFKNLF